MLVAHIPMAVRRLAQRVSAYRDSVDDYTRINGAENWLKTAPDGPRYSAWQ